MLSRIIEQFDYRPKNSLKDIYDALDCVTPEARKYVHGHVVKLRRSGKLKLIGGKYCRVDVNPSPLELRKAVEGFLKRKSLGFTASQVLKGDLYGAYTGICPDLGLVEYVMHELAHALTLGRTLSEIPDGLNDWIDATLDGMPSYTSDVIEIDTSAVVYLAGVELGLWADSKAIAYSTRRNLKAARMQIDAGGCFSKIFESSSGSKATQAKAHHLATFMRAL